MKFQLQITLGNEAMTTAEDVASALYKLADTLVDRTSAAYEDLDPATSVTIKDRNGNTVGKAEVVK